MFERNLVKLPGPYTSGHKLFPFYIPTIRSSFSLPDKIFYIAIVKDKQNTTLNSIRLMILKWIMKKHMNLIVSKLLSNLMKIGVLKKWISKGR